MVFLLKKYVTQYKNTQRLLRVFGRNDMVSEPQEKTLTKSEKARTYLFLHGILLVYSLSAVCSKMAAGYPFLSLEFILWYGAVLLLLGVYALVWQQVLKRLPLTTAFANKGITIVWGMLWGALLFGEQLSLTMFIGAALVFVGILLVVTSNG